MGNKIVSMTQNAMDALDRLADSYGIARATQITLLANHLIDIRRAASDVQKELEELRRFKEEHGDDPSQSNEV